MKKLISVIAAALLLSAANVSAQLTTQRIVFDEKPSEYGYLAYKFVDENGNEIEPQYEESISLFSSLPSYYRNENLTPVKNQGSEGCCWAFAMVGAMEASLIQQGYVTPQNIDLSEAHMAYFSKNLYDSIYRDGNIFEKPEDKIEEAYTNGGHEYYALAALSKGSGAVSEGIAPYAEYTGENKKEIEEEKRFLSEATLSTFVPLDAKNRVAIKTAIMEFGGVLNIFFSGDAEGGIPFNDYYNKEKKAYHYPYNTTQNHQTLIVGWDDSFSKDNFNEDYRPDNNGAWIVRNSWSDSFGEEGYFYISYETPIKTATAVRACMETYDNNYGYTGALVFEGLYYNSIALNVANVFTAKNDEVLEEVSFTIVQPEMAPEIYANYTGEVTVTVYTGVKDTPGSGRKELEMKTDMEGTFKRIKLTEPINLYAGEKFAVSVKGAAVLLEPTENTSYQGQTYVTNPTWKYVGVDSSIRAYTNDNKPKVTALINNEKILAESKYNDNAEIYIAQYDKNDVLIDVKKSTEASLKKNTTKYKVFSWNGKMHSTTETAFVKGVN